MQLSLKLLNGEQIELNIDSNVCIIGRSSKCDVVVTQDGMSRQHCQIEVIDGEVFVTDLASTNGVLIDGQKIKPNTRTNYALYLTLSFGAVQSAQIKLDEVYRTNVPKDIGTKSKMTKPISGPDFKLTESSKASRNLAPYIWMVLIFLAIILAINFWPKNRSSIQTESHSINSEEYD